MRVKIARQSLSTPLRAIRLRNAAEWLFKPPNLNRETALRGSERLSAITHIVSAAEHLARPEYKERGGPDDWEILGPRIPEKFKFRRLVGNIASKPTVTTALDVGQVAAGGLLLLPTSSRTRLVANGFMAATNQLMRDRRQLGGDGSDHARTICNDMAFVARLGHRNPAVVDAALWGLGLQSTMSYTVSGAAKVMGPWWREGIAIERIMRTRSFGHEGVFKLARSYPRTTKACSHAIVAFECAAPLVYLFRGQLAKPYAIGAAAMHLGIGHTMALGRFIPSFGGMLCGLLYTSSPRSDHTQTGPKRSDLAPEYAAASLVGGLGVMAASVLYDRRENRRPKPNEAFFRTSDGSVLYYERHGKAKEGEDSPIFFLENGVGGPREQYLQLVMDLAEIGEVVTYHRAGLGPSQLGVGAGTSFEDTTSRAAELVGHIDRRDCRLLLLGHARGCPFTLGTAAQLDDGPHGVLILDLPPLNEGFDSLDAIVRNFELQERKMRWFLGVGMVPSKNLNLPGDNKVQSRLDKVDYRSLAVYLRDPTTWELSVKEIRALAAGPPASLDHDELQSLPVTLVASRSALNVREGYESGLAELVDANANHQLLILEDENRGDGVSVLSGKENRTELIDIVRDMAVRKKRDFASVERGREAQRPGTANTARKTDLDLQDVER